ncbi:hypothetical protein Acr_15g0010330 [Actinidia rufa]|uniref:Rx N-terminal domain-containing protein n=1 Tax=Actinidia rufa TaxID=165716 RepID=A0A7J0FUP4_9ERIC|nr:hypothetical protein Acr_15g0010330 [Actinidia rufa]
MVIGEIFLAASITLLFDKLASGELWKFARREGIYTALKKWTRMLEEIEAVLADAEEKQITERGIQMWLEDLEDLAYDLDDVLDEIATEALRRKLMHQEPPASTSKVRALIPTCLRPSTLLSDFRMKSKLDEITPRLQNLFERRSGLGLQKVAAVASARGSQRTETTSLIHEPCVHGRDEDKKAIMELLLSDQNDVRLQHWLPALRRLQIESCPQLISLFEEEKEGQQQQCKGLPNIMNLEYLKIHCCQKLEKLPRGLPSTLRTLLIYECDSLQSLPELMMLNDLEKLEVGNCSALTCLCPGAGLPSTLKQLHIYRCGKLEAVLAKGMTINCPSLESIDIRFCDNLKTLPDVIQKHDLRNLNMLAIEECDNLESLPKGWFPTPNLRDLVIKGCKKLDALPQSAYNKNRNLTSLQQLDIGSSPAATGIASYVLKEGRSLTNLTELSIGNIDNPPSEWGLHRTRVAYLAFNTVHPGLPQPRIHCSARAASLAFGTLDL